MGVFMKCFYHQAVDSIGVCRHCGRGLCPECITEYPDALACKGKHEEQVKDVVLLVQRNTAAVARAGLSRYLFPVFFTASGVAFVAEGLQRLDQSNHTDLIYGCLLLGVGVISFSVVRRVYKK